MTMGKPHRGRRSCAAAFAAVLALFAGGCNIVGPAVVLLSPPPTQKEEYELPVRTTVVFVDDRKNALGDRALRRLIGDTVCEHLMREEKLVDTIETASVLRAVGDEQRGALKPIDQIGREVGAAQVIYIEMLAFNVQTDAGGRPLAQAHLNVKVIDVENRARLFPVETESRQLFVDLPSETAFQTATTRADAREAERALAVFIADRVAKLFYEYEIRPLNPGVQPG